MLPLCTTNIQVLFRKTDSITSILIMNENSVFAKDASCYIYIDTTICIKLHKFITLLTFITLHTLTT